MNSSAKTGKGSLKKKGSNMGERGKFIVFEGVGGSGKTTQTALGGEYLRGRGRKVKVTGEPGGVTQAEVLRRLIFTLKEAGAANPDHQIALFFAARDFWVRGLVTPNIEFGIDVLDCSVLPIDGGLPGLRGRRRY